MHQFFRSGVPALLLFTVVLLPSGGCSQKTHPQPKAESAKADAPEPMGSSIVNKDIPVGETSAAKKVVPGVPMMRPDRPIPSTGGIGSSGVPARAAIRAVPGSPLVVPGVSPNASEEVLKMSMERRKEIDEASNPSELQTVFQTALIAFDSLYDRYKENTKYPMTASFIFGKKLECYADAIQREVPQAQEDFDTYVESFRNQNPDSE